jgi:hypothetical protein
MLQNLWRRNILRRLKKTKATEATVADVGTADFDRPHPSKADTTEIGPVIILIIAQAQSNSILPSNIDDTNGSFKRQADREMAEVGPVNLFAPAHEPYVPQMYNGRIWSAPARFSRRLVVIQHPCHLPMSVTTGSTSV